MGVHAIPSRQLLAACTTTTTTTACIWQCTLHHPKGANRSSHNDQCSHAVPPQVCCANTPSSTITTAMPYHHTFAVPFAPGSTTTTAMPYQHTFALPVQPQQLLQPCRKAYQHTFAAPIAPLLWYLFQLITTTASFNRYSHAVLRDAMASSGVGTKRRISSEASMALKSLLVMFMSAVLTRLQSVLMSTASSFPDATAAAAACAAALAAGSAGEAAPPLCA